MPKIVDHQQRRAELIETAVQAIAEKGLDNTSLADVARAAGYSANLVAHYFDNKKHLLEEVHRYVSMKAIERFADARDRNVVSLVSSVLPDNKEKTAEEQVRMEFWLKAVRDPELRASNDQMMRRARSGIREFLREEQRAGKLKQHIDINQVTERILGLAASVSLQMLLEPRKYTKNFARKLIASSLADIFDQP